MRTYERTHPWISFTLDLRSAPPELWMILGEIKSKCEHIAGIPLNRETAEKLYNLALIRGVRATTAIEGNTLTEEQVGKRIEGKLKLPESQEYLGKEIDNVVNACNSILRSIVQGISLEFTPKSIADFNRTILDGLPLEKNVIPGEIRTYSVGVGKYEGAPAEDCPYLLQRLCEFLNENRSGIKGFDATITAVLLAIMAHLYIAWIHPFGDGNGRSARLVEFMLLLEGGVPAPAAHLLSNHYNLTRQVYYSELDRAGRSGGDIIPFLSYAAKGFLDGLRGQLSEIQQYQLRVIWFDQVSRILQNEMEGTSVEVMNRRRDLVITLSHRTVPVPVSNIALLTPDLAKAYARKTRKTLIRDLNALNGLALVEIGRDGARALSEMVLAFLPPRKKVQ
jgi:Fic family protein